ncbi:hypothetical protein ACL655_22230 [Klebsiella quasipneumoniae subsp. similipneumoniae]
MATLRELIVGLLQTQSFQTEIARASAWDKISKTMQMVGVRQLRLQESQKALPS